LGFSKTASYPLQLSRLKGKLAMVEELLSAQEALKIE
jgi:hypothetical protein